MTKAKYSVNVGIKYFYKLFKARKIKFPLSYFFKQKQGNPFMYVKESLFKSIIITYFDNYFKDFYFQNNPQYFFLSGKLIKAKGKDFYKTKDGFNLTKSINWIWYERPASNYVTNLKIIKLKGNSSRLNKLEQKYKEIYDVDLLPKTIALLNELNTNNKLHK